MSYVIYEETNPNEYLFWQHDFGWVNLEQATLYEEQPSLLLDGYWLDVGDTPHLAALMLDLASVLEEHPDTNIASPAGRLALARWQAEKLAGAGNENYKEWQVKSYSELYEMRTAIAESHDSLTSEENETLGKLWDFLFDYMRNANTTGYVVGFLDVPGTVNEDAPDD